MQPPSSIRPLHLDEQTNEVENGTDVVLDVNAALQQTKGAGARAALFLTHFSKSKFTFK